MFKKINLGLFFSLFSIWLQAGTVFSSLPAQSELRDLNKQLFDVVNQSDENFPEAQRLINLGASAEWLDYRRRSTFMNACLKGYTKIVDLFLTKARYRVFENFLDYDGNSAFMLACAYGRTEVVRLLLDPILKDYGYHIEVNHSNHYLDTALILASRNGHTEVVRLLLNPVLKDYGFNIEVNRSNNHLDTALISASSNGHTEVVRLLLDPILKDYGCSININLSNAYDNTALKLACINGYTDIVKLLLEQPDLDVSIAGNDIDHLIAIALEKGYLEVVSQLEGYARWHSLHAKPEGIRVAMAGQDFGLRSAWVSAVATVGRLDD